MDRLTFRAVKTNAIDNIFYFLPSLNYIFLSNFLCLPYSILLQDKEACSQLIDQEKEEAEVTLTSFILNNVGSEFPEKPRAKILLLTMLLPAYF